MTIDKPGIYEMRGGGEAWVYFIHGNIAHGINHGDNVSDKWFVADGVAIDSSKDEPHTIVKYLRQLPDSPAIPVNRAEIRRQMAHEYMVVAVRGGFDDPPSEDEIKGVAKICAKMAGALLKELEDK